MAAKVLCIELGERLTKVCERGANNRIHKCFSFLTPEGTVADGQITDPARLGEALREALSKNGLGARRKAAFVIRSGRIASREVKLPPVRDNRLKPMVEANASEYFPVDMSKYHISYTVLERKERGADAFCRLQVLAVPLSMLEGYFKMAESANLQAEAVDCAGNCLYRILTSLPGGGVTMYVDVGCVSSDVTVLDGKRLMLQRSFPVGGDELVFAQMNADGTSESEYIAALGRLCGDSCSLPQEVVAESLSRLCGNILRIADYYNSNNWEAPVEKLVLTGDCGALYGLRKHLEESVAYPVEVMPELAGYTAGARSAPLSSAYLACLGCPMQRTDFIPEAMGRKNKKPKKKAADSLSLGVVVFAGLLAVGIAVSASAVFDYRTAAAEQAQMKRELKELENAKKLYDTCVDYTAAKDGFQAVYDAADTPNADLLEFIAELERKMPAGIAVLSAVCGSDGVSMNVTVGSKDAAAMVIAQLRTFESLSEITIGAISETADDNGIVQVSFAVNCLYGENPYLAASAGN